MSNCDISCKSAVTIPARTVLAYFMLVLLASPEAIAISIELKGASPDRIERQRKAATGRLPLPGTPNTENRTVRLAQKGLKSGNPVFVRIFKEESELELWMNDGQRFVHFATYPICNWSGGLGPKLVEGDKQAPEGFYTVTRRRLHRTGRWPRSLNLGFPNVLDQAMARTGSYILIHGGCTSVGCFAMTNPVIDEIYSLTKAAIDAGQNQVHIHVMPFRMTDKKLARHAKSEWFGFWQSLKQGYDAFEKTKVPPQIDVCEGKYKVRDGAGSVAELERPVVPCSETAALARTHRQFAEIIERPAQWEERSPIERGRLKLLQTRAHNIVGQLERRPAFKGNKVTRRVARRTRVTCKLTLASCRRHMALKYARLRKGTDQSASHKIVRRKVRPTGKRHALAHH